MEECDNKALRIEYDKVNQRLNYLLQIKTVSSAKELEKLAPEFAKLGDYSDASSKVQLCRDSAETMRESVYDASTERLKNASSMADVDAAEKVFIELGAGYKQVADQLLECRQKRELFQKFESLDARKRNLDNQKASVTVAQQYDALAKEYQVLEEETKDSYKSNACLDKAAQVRSTLYQGALNDMQAAKTKLAYEKASSVFKELDDYRDSPAKVQECLDAIEALRHAEERAALEAKCKKTKKTLAIAIPTVIVIAVLVLLFAYILPKGHYEKGLALFSEKKWDEAKEEFVQSGSYNDAAVMAQEADYQKALQLLGAGNYEEAQPIFKSIGGFKDSSTQYNECIYQRANDLFSSANYDEAYKEYIKINGYKDVDTILTNTVELKIALGNNVTYKDNEWIIIWKEDGKAVLLSRLCLATMAVRSAPDDFTTYNNGAAVKSRASQLIPGSTILTQDEVEKYLPNPSDRIAENGAWWLADNGTAYLDSGSPYVNKYMGETVTTNGSFRALDSRFESGVRPALTISQETLKQALQN